VYGRALAWLACAALMLGGLAAAANAENAPAACRADIGKLCSKVEPGAGRIRACLEAHEAELSPACLRRLDGLEQEVGRLAARCRWDVAQYCTDVPMGASHVLQCLQTNESQLSPGCQDAMRERAEP
jgi:hypothetical protein